MLSLVPTADIKESDIEIQYWLFASVEFNCFEHHCQKYQYQSICYAVSALFGSPAIKWLTTTKCLKLNEDYTGQETW